MTIASRDDVVLTVTGPGGLTVGPNSGASFELLAAGDVRPPLVTFGPGGDDRDGRSSRCEAAQLIAGWTRRVEVM